MLRITPLKDIVCASCKAVFERLKGHALWVERSRSDVPGLAYWSRHRFVCRHGANGETYFCAGCAKKCLPCPQCGTQEES